MIFFLYISHRNILILIRYFLWYLLSSFEEKQEEIKDIIKSKRLFVVDLLYNIVSERLLYLHAFRERILPNFSN